MAKIEDELDSIEYKEERIEELIHKQQNILADLVIEAQNLTKIRTNIAKELIQKITTELTGLHMDKTVIDIQIKSAESGDEVEYGGHDYRLRSDGCDDVAIYISPNPGEPLKPLSKIASGGELSRLMLALKTVFSKLEPVATLIFDEVDTGVSGRVAQAMGDKLYQISKDQQVLCITHHPQVAAMADEHYRIVKEIVGEETKTSIVPLQKEERIEELARMMSGMEVTSVTLQHAEELILSAEKIKEGVSSALNRI